MISVYESLHSPTTFDIDTFVSGDVPVGYRHMYDTTLPVEITHLHEEYESHEMSIYSAPSPVERDVWHVTVCTCE